MTLTPNLGFTKYSGSWFDDNPGKGTVHLVNVVLDNLDSVLGAKIRVPISSTQLLNMKASPIVIVPSFGAGVIPMVRSAVFQYKPVSADYSLGDAANLFIGPASNPSGFNTLQQIAAAILSGADGPGNAIAKASAANTSAASQSQFENQALVLTHDGSAEITSGDGTAVVYLGLDLVILQ